MGEGELKENPTVGTPAPCERCGRGVSGYGSGPRLEKARRWPPVVPRTIELAWTNILLTYGYRPSMLHGYCPFTHGGYKESCPHGDVTVELGRVRILCPVHGQLAGSNSGF